MTVHDDVRATLRSSIKRLLMTHECPPDQQAGATKLVLDPMERLAAASAEGTSTEAASHQPAAA